jgi:type IV pilus assembly protein PilM
MSLWSSLSRLVKDPPPSHVFELSDEGLAYAHQAQTGYEPFPPGTLRASPLQDNVLRAETIASLLGRVTPPNGSKRRAAAILLPDAAVRVSVLDFDSFPDAADEQAALVRFRVKKTIPFDIDSASVSYYLQTGTNRHGKKEVVAATISLEVLARYEALFRNAGFQPGEVTVSALGALHLVRGGEEVAVLAKLAGKSLTIVVVASGKLKLFRCLALEEASEQEILAVLHPTFAYAEDELGSPVRRLILCGFDQAPEGLPCPIESLRGRAGAPNAFNAGLFGYLDAFIH